MKREEFVSKLCDEMEDRVVEICDKFETHNVNLASLPAFWMGLEMDIMTFLTKHGLTITQSKSNTIEESEK